MALNPHAVAALVHAAGQARQRAYAPYSQFDVGAALACADGQTVTAANVENCAYGLSLCAERSAIVAALACGHSAGDFTALAVVVDAATVAAPCGACRQVLAEFCGPHLPVYLHNLRDGASVSYLLGELLPHAFAPTALAR